MIQDIDNINVSIQSDDSINVTIDNDSISVSEATPTDIAEIMHNEEIRQENEAQRIANEEQRIINEQAREDYIDDLKQRVLDGEFNGEDGYSPTANVVKSGSTSTITITDKNGTTTADVLDGTNGVDGKDGQDGKDGEDGYSPSASVSKVGKIATITITDENGTTTCEIRDGEDGHGSGDMLKATYDTNDNGIVDNAEKVNNHTVLTDVPADAVFTDTTYTAGTGIDITNNVISSTQSSAEWGNITGTLTDQTDLLTALNLKLDNTLQNTLTGSSSSNPIILDGLTHGTYPMYSTTDKIYLKLDESIQDDRFIQTNYNGGNAFLIVPETIDYSSLENNDLICYIIHNHQVNGKSFLRVSVLIYDNTFNGNYRTNAYYVFLGKVLTDDYQEIHGSKSFEDSVAFTDGVSTYSVFNINPSDEDESVFSFGGTSSDTPTWDYKVKFNNGLETNIAPSSGNDITNKTYVDDTSKMVILSYGSSTWNDFITAYNNNKIVYCRASSNSNPATGSQTRLAFMAYVNNATTPTSVEFQYYRSVSSHSATQQGDQVFVYKLTNSSGGTWSVETREAMVNVDVSDGLSRSYSSNKLTISGAGKQDVIDSSHKLDADLVDDSTATNKFVTATDKTTWSGKQDALVSGTNIKTINSTSLLGSGDISIPVISVDSNTSTSSTNPIENQAITNYVDDEIAELNTTELTEATLNTTYFSTIDYNSVVRVGKVVTVSIRALFKANTSGTITLATFPFNFKDGGEVVGYLGGRYDYANGAVWMYTGSGRYLYIGTNNSLNGKWFHLVYTYIMP